MPFFLCVLLLLLSPLVMGIENLNQAESAKVLEFYLVFLGPLLLVPVFLPEQNREIRELVSSKYTSIGQVYTLRILLALGEMAFLQAAYMGVMRAENCTFSFGSLYLGSLCGMVFLGGAGVFFYALTDQAVIGYMLPVLYYMVCIGSGEEKLGVFYLFSMSIGRPEWKYFLAAAGILALAAGVRVRMRRG